MKRLRQGSQYVDQNSNLGSPVYEVGKVD